MTDTHVPVPEPTLGSVKQELDQLREELKSRQTSRVAAVRTAVVDMAAWIRRDRREFPTEAAIGLINAVLFPRVVLLLGSLIGVIAYAAGCVPKGRLC